MALGFLALNMGLLLTGTDTSPVEISASKWFNAHTIQVPDDRTYIVLFFSTVQGEKQTQHYLKRLHRIRRNDDDVVVVGLSGERASRIERFVKANNIHFPIGAGSKTYRQFQIREFPAIVIIDPGEESPTSLASLDELSEYVDFANEERDVRLVSGDFSKQSDVTTLQRHARNDDDESQRQRALTLLREKMEPAEFRSLCDDLLESAGDSVTLMGDIAYQRHLADPDVKVKEPIAPPSSAARKALLENPGGPEWRRLRDYKDTIQELSPEQLLSDYFEYRADPNDQQSLLMRHEIASRFNGISDNGSAEEKALARRLLMQMYPGEPDAGVRLYLVGALWATASPGDVEVAGFLEEQLKTEHNIRSVRPMMEMALRCMRTGEGPCGE